jgi:hypothetical protein
MAERRNGLAPVPTGLFRPTTAGAADGPADEPADAGDEQGRGEHAPAAESRASAPRPRRKRVPAGGETRGRKLSLPDAVYDRLQLLAIQRRTSASSIAAEILDRNLPRLRIERDA